MYQKFLIRAFQWKDIGVAVQKAEESRRSSQSPVDFGTDFFRFYEKVSGKQGSEGFHGFTPLSDIQLPARPVDSNPGVPRSFSRDFEVFPLGSCLNLDNVEIHTVPDRPRWVNRSGAFRPFPVGKLSSSTEAFPPLSGPVSPCRNTPSRTPSALPGRRRQGLPRSRSHCGSGRT